MKNLAVPILLALSISCSSSNTAEKVPLGHPELPEAFEGMETKPIRVLAEGGKEINLEARIASTAVQQAAGFQNVPAEVVRKTFILFVFPDNHTSPFHMRNVLASLDIFWFDADGKVVSLQRMDPDPQRLWSAGGIYRYALEGPAGFAAEHGLGADSRLVLPLL